ncbi:MULTISPECIES: SRPBCC family protein [Nitratireductor]|uniref:SRPBCC family protein n=1 Tax=Nitratireductor TaxID=245876 RepID=UPI000DDCF7DC|nr:MULTISPECIES: SRPBCC family protein [Nitratireductor]MBN7774709.1 SRPBCC family protein [Nitratireductor pacificus]MBN7763564.1 SRPBCC family protein [Nitratireductor aquibiodomus]MBN7779570.1 SRPBCC family protein [Nitratireductor pacificus]MBN7788377.1 SRPBCC family protein [Nitratireductor aquimarinus]MBY6097096.1 SRPBCC family protein [Nitratireductor aquimarinus]
MTETIDVKPETEHELVLARIIAAPREKIFRAWTDPEILKQWFVPKPWTIARAELDVRPGGKSLIVMRDPEGNEYPNPGVFLEVVENEKIVTTDAYTDAWTPAAKPFMTMILTLEDAGEGKTRYIARALHWSAEDVAAHEKMGFHEGWGQCAEQLEEVAARL